MVWIMMFIKRKSKLGLLFLLLILLGFLVVNVTISVYKAPFMGFYTSKIYGHRVNYLNKLQQAKSSFIGVELDLVYLEDLNLFDVRHPPEASTNFYFEDYLNEIGEENDLKLWLDIKNLNSDNAENILARMDYLLKTHNRLRESILIETVFPDALSMFQKAGYTTSYYLPYLHLLSKSDQKDTLSYIKNTLKTYPELGISTHYMGYPILENEFPESSKYLWALGGNNIYKDIFLIRKLLKDQTVKIVLVSF
ncbi:hypothetical protein GCM10022257_22780 [Hyunsoonleella aestuarii]|uniref:Glycerophosphodiester phosphodiesterase n=2 Tax=Hyunsoonleella aestuarii TaxID=912802 RepID=A0ABP8ED75_9FLAO